MKKIPIPPLFVTLFALSVLSLTAENALRFGAALATWKTLREYASRPSAFFIAFSGLAWASIGIVLFKGLWFGESWARKASLVAVFAYVLYDWGNRLFFQASPPHHTQAFTLGVYLFWIFFAILALSLPRSKKFFAERETHDR